MCTNMAVRKVAFSGNGSKLLHIDSVVILTALSPKMSREVKRSDRKKKLMGYVFTNQSLDFD